MSPPVRLLNTVRLLETLEYDNMSNLCLFLVRPVVKVILTLGYHKESLKGVSRISAQD